MTKLAALAMTVLAATALADTRKLDIKQADLHWMQPFGPQGPQIAERDRRSSPGNS